MLIFYKKINLSIVAIGVLLLVVTSCSHPVEKISVYGAMQFEKTANHVQVPLSKFTTYGNFLDRLYEISCADSIPSILIKKKEYTKFIYPEIYCEPISFCPKGDFYLEVYKDQIIYSSKKIIDAQWLQSNFKSVFKYQPRSLKIDLKPTYLVLIHSDRASDLLKLQELLYQITEQFNKVEVNAQLAIYLYETLPIPPPPPIE